MESVSSVGRSFSLRGGPAGSPPPPRGAFPIPAADAAAAADALGRGRAATFQRGLRPSRAAARRRAAVPRVHLFGRGRATGSARSPRRASAVSAAAPKANAPRRRSRRAPARRRRRARGARRPPMRLAHLGDLHHLPRDVPGDSPRFPPGHLRGVRHALRERAPGRAGSRGTVDVFARAQSVGERRRASSAADAHAAASSGASPSRAATPHLPANTSSAMRSRRRSMAPMSSSSPSRPGARASFERDAARGAPRPHHASRSATRQRRARSRAQKLRSTGRSTSSRFSSRESLGDAHIWNVRSASDAASAASRRARRSRSRASTNAPVSNCGPAREGRRASRRPPPHRRASGGTTTPSMRPRSSRARDPAARASRSALCLTARLGLKKPVRGFKKTHRKSGRTIGADELSFRTFAKTLMNQKKIFFETTAFPVTESPKEALATFPVRKKRFFFLGPNGACWRRQISSSRAIFFDQSSEPETLGAKRSLRRALTPTKGACHV